MTVPAREISRSAQDYLKAIYQLGDGSGPVLTSRLAEQLGVAAPSATNMIGRLAEAGMLRHTRYHGVALIGRGAAVALEAIRHHRLWGLFLHRALGVPIDHLHDEGERLEHELSDALEERMTRLLGDPTHDRAREPFDSPLTLRFGAGERVIGHALARRVQVEPRTDRAPATTATRGA